MEIIKKDDGRKGIFLAVKNGIQVGEMTYVWGGEDKIIIDHTGVSSQYQEQGIGKKLFVRAVDFARENDIKILPLCPFAAAMFEKMPETNDVL